MKVLILNGSFRRGQNTDTLLEPVIDTLRAAQIEVETVLLSEKKIAPCTGCYACQNVFGAYGCVQHDDMYAIADAMQACDCFLLATPIYTWYCTAPMKAMLDRHYGMNKFYGHTPGPSLWAGKKCGIVATCGYEIEDGTGPFEKGITRLCEHSDLEYVGMLAWRDLDDRASFITPEAIAAATAYGEQLVKHLTA